MTRAGAAGRWSRRLAVGFGLLLAVVEAAFNWVNPSWWPLILVDYLAVALLLYGALRSPRVLAVGWGFTAAMFYMAFVLSVEAGDAPTPLLAAMGVMFVVPVAGLVLTLIEARSDPPPVG